MDGELAGWFEGHLRGRLGVPVSVVGGSVFVTTRAGLVARLEVEVGSRLEGWAEGARIERWFVGLPGWMVTGGTSPAAVGVAILEEGGYEC